MRVGVYAATLFVSAGLLFSVQPMIARFALPWFGGGAGVWSVCLLFFQTSLVLGYLYVHAITRWLSRRQQIGLHALVILLSLACLPMTPSDALDPTRSGAPVLDLLGLLVLTLALPTFVLCCSAPLLQGLLPGVGDAGAFRLYAVSNLGSLLGLLLYPLLLEPTLGLVEQSRLWSATYLLFALGSGACLLLAWRSQAQALDPQGDSDARAAPSDRGQRVLWLILSLFGVVLFLGVGNQLTVNILPLPLLWVLPLALYLSSYVCCFARDGWYHRRTWTALYGLSVLPTLLMSSMPLLLGPYLAIAVSCFGIFAGCMVCHGELAALKPGKSELTSFHLHLAIGGSMGSAFVTFVAPLVFSRYWELQVGLFGVIACLGLCVLRQVDLESRLRMGALGMGVEARVGGGRVRMLAWSACCVLLAIICSYPLRQEEGTIAAERNFYGRLSVVQSDSEYGETRYLLHGRIRHGAQRLDLARRREPTLYYGPDSGVAIAIERSATSRRRVGIIGLGVGTLATYGRQGDVFRFYEIDPMVQSMATHYFSFLTDSPAQIELVPGDARLALEGELSRTSMAYDLLVLDAFSSDAIPTHLLTREAFALYFGHITNDGVVAVNVSNAFLDLVPLVRAHAEAASKSCHWIYVEPSEQAASGSSWLLIGTGKSFLADPVLSDRSRSMPPASATVWTDDYSSLLGLLR